MLKIINEGPDDDDVCNNWDEEGTPPSIIYLEDSKGQCVAQVLCSNEEEQSRMSRLLSACTDMKQILDDISSRNKDSDIEILKFRIQPLLDYINGGSNEG